MSKLRRAVIDRSPNLGSPAAGALYEQPQFFSCTNPIRAAGLALLLFFTTVFPAGAQSVRDRTRPNYTKDTAVSESQAADLTLTLSPVAVRAIQTWVRTGATVDKTGKILTAYVYPPDAALVKEGQRANSFTPESKSSMTQARITRRIDQGGRVLVEATLAAEGRHKSRYHVLEIFVERGEFLSIPNEAIIEEGDQQIVYVEKEPGHYLPQPIRTGLRGELYTEVLEGLKEGAQVVTIGSFFIDSEFKLKATAETPLEQ